MVSCSNMRGTARRAGGEEPGERRRRSCREDGSGEIELFEPASPRCPSQESLQREGRRIAESLAVIGCSIGGETSRMAGDTE